MDEHTLMEVLPDDVIELIIKWNCPQLLLVNKKYYHLVKKNICWLCNIYHYSYNMIFYWKTPIHNNRTDHGWKKDLKSGIMVGLRPIYTNNVKKYIVEITNKYFQIIRNNNNFVDFFIRGSFISNKSYLDCLRHINFTELLILYYDNQENFINYVLDKKDWDIRNFVSCRLVDILELRIV